MSKREEYKHIVFAGRVNVGKSSLLNLLSGQDDFAIVDAQPGTTADTVVTRMEIHGLGPLKIFDTAGMDEYSELGEKKRKKTQEAIEESDLVLLVLNLLDHKKHEDFSIEKEIVKHAHKHDKQVLVVYNLFSENENHDELQKWADSMIGFDLPSFYLNAQDKNHQRPLVEFVKKYFKKENRDIDLLPIKGEKGFVLMNIPMDEETPMLRLLRPQDMALERLLRKFFVPVLYRMDLTKARAGDEEEKARYQTMIKNLKNTEEGLKLIITDSQAMDIVDPWTPDTVELTTFSVMMANYMSGGNLPLFIKSLDILPTLNDGDKVLIMESCNHDRKCNDIGTVQIPNLLKSKLNIDLSLDFSFGRPLPEDLSEYKLVIHCGGCMVDRQRYIRRIEKLQELGIPVTNYGLFLSWVNNPEAVERVSAIYLDSD